MRKHRIAPSLAAFAITLIGLGWRDAGALPCGVGLDDPCTVSNGTASISYDPVDNAANDFELAGLEDWTIDGVPQLFLQVFAIKIGAGPTTNLGNLTLGPADADDVNDLISASYSTGAGGDLVTIELMLGLGSAPGTLSSIDVAVDITAGAILFATPISFFMYTDLDLAGTFDGDTGSSTADTLTQSDGPTVVKVRTSTPTSGFQVDDNIQNPFVLFDAIVDGTLGGSLLLNNATGPLSGDINHAFQWTYTPTAENPSFAIRSSTAAVPAPAPFALVGLGLIGIGLLRRKA
ncbi:MAG: hypothetical protein WD673_06410 [Alphaproteobacteria bacterium]